MKAKKYTNSSWVQGDYEKEYSTATDTYTTLPATFQTNGADAENYQVYGASSGVGDETGNLWDPNAKDASNGYMNGYYLRNDNRTEAANTWCVSEYIEVSPNTQYTLKWTTAESPSATLPSICQYDANKDFISNSGTSYDANNTVTITTTATTKYIRFSGVISRWNAEAIRFNLGSTVIDVPPGYKIPILNTSGNLWNGEIEQGGINIGGSLVESAMRVRSCITNLVGGQTYFIKSNQNIRMIYAYYGSWTGTKIGLFLDNNDYITEYTFKLPEGANSIGVALMTYPETNIVPSDVTTAILANSSNYDLFIGDSKLYEDEYVDFVEQKVYKLKEVHKDTVTIDGVEWDILGYDHDEVYGGDGNLAQHSVTIQTHDCIANLQFDAKEALFAFPSGLSAGTYHFTVSQQPWYSGDVGKTMQFTLLNDIPTDGVIVLGNAYNATMIGSTISVYASSSATTASETATISEGSDGTDLGSVGDAISGDTNSIQRAIFGNGNYHQSAIRQYLNSDGTAGSYWTPQNKWDRIPSWYASQAGFLNGYNVNFKNVIGTTKKVTALNAICDGGGTETTNEKVFLLSQTELYCGGSEGTAYDYYKNYSDLPSAGAGADSNRIKNLSGTARYWWTRSANVSYTSFASYIGATGAQSSSSTEGDRFISTAVCIPLDNINNDPYLQSLFLKPIDPPAPFPALHTYIGENNLSVDTTVQPEKVALTVAAWREIEGEKYQNEEWSDNNGT